MRIASRMRPEGRRAIATPTYGQEIITDFSAGTDAAIVDASTLNASTFGVNSTGWSVVNIATHMTYSTAAKRPFGGTLPAQSVNPWPGDTGSLGVNLYIPDATPRYAKYTYPATVPLVVTASVWFKTDYPATAAPNIDVFWISGTDGNFVNVPFAGNGSTLRLAAEYQDVLPEDKIGTPVPISPNTWYLIALRYSSSAAVPHTIRVYDTTLTQVGNEQSAVPGRTSASGTANQVRFGFCAAPGNVYGYNLMYSGLVFTHDGTCRWPLLPV